MQILFVTHYTTLYGANKSLLTLLQGLIEKGHKCIVLSPGLGPFTDELKKLNIPFSVVAYKWWVLEDSIFPSNFFRRAVFYKNEIYRLFYWNYKALRQIKRLIPIDSVDLIYSNSSVTFLGLLAAFYFRKPHVWHLREFSTLHYNYKPIFGEYIFKEVINRVGYKVCISTAIQSYFLKNTYRSTVIYNGVLTKNFILNNVEKRTQKVKKFVIIGLLHKNKNQAEAIKALAIVLKKNNNVQLLIAGEGNEKEALIKLVNDLRVADKVIFLNYVIDVVNLLKGCYALLMCSRNEGMGRVTAEAMCLGIPVIGFKGGGTIEMVDHDVNGLLYEDNEFGLASAMLKLLNDENCREQLSQNAIKKALKKFTVENYVNSVDEVIRSVVKKKDEVINK